MHPNATISLFSAVLVSLAIYIAGRFGYTLSTQDAVALLGAVTTFLLWIGRRGVKAAAVSIWRGQPKATEPQA